MYESFARKGWEGGGLDAVLAISPDRRAEEGPEDKEAITEENDNDNDSDKDNDGDVKEPEIFVQGDKVHSHRTIDDENGVTDGIRDLKNKSMGGRLNSETDTDRYQLIREGLIHNKTTNKQEKNNDIDSPRKDGNITDSKVEDTLNTIKLNLKKVHTSSPEADKHNDELDESFSLPIVHNLKSLLRGDEEDEQDEGIDSSNILQELAL